MGRSTVLGFLGLVPSCVSDCCSNSLRVIKTTKQTAELTSANVVPKGKDDKVGGSSSGQELGLILEQDGWIGLFGRGLQTRLLINALQGALLIKLFLCCDTISQTNGVLNFTC